MDNDSFCKCVKETLHTALGLDNNCFIWRAAACVGMWSAVAGISGLLLPFGGSFLQVLTDVLVPIALALLATWVTVKLFPRRRKPRGPGPWADAKQLIEQADRAIANGGRGIDITDLSDEEFLARLRTKGNMEK